MAVEVSVVVCEESTFKNSRARATQETLWFVLLRFSGLIAGVLLLAAPLGSQTPPEWQAEVRKYTAAQDWISAMRIVDREAAAAPRDMDVRAWRARGLTWSGQLRAAEQEYLEILKIARNDPDDCMGLAAMGHNARGKLLRAGRDPRRKVFRRDYGTLTPLGNAYGRRRSGTRQWRDSEERSFL